MKKTDLRIIKTLQRIDRALIENLAECPFQKITVNMLCESALINRSTFYHYYLDKYDLLEKYLNRTLEEFRRNINVEFINAEPSSIHDVCYIRNFEEALKFISGKKEEYQILWNASIDRRIFHEMTEIIRDNILSALSLSPDPGIGKYTDLYASLFASNMMSLVRWWFQYSDQISMREIEEIMTDNMYFGLFKTFKNRLNRSRKTGGT